jgi:hypothetical protein
MPHNVSGHNAVVFAATERVREAVFNKSVQPRPSAHYQAAAKTMERL